VEENKASAEEEGGILGWSVSLLFIAAPAKPKEGKPCTQAIPFGEKVCAALPEFEHVSE
jgi:hypothetical protein